MATVTAAISSADSTDGISFSTAAFTPAAGDLVVVFVHSSGETSTDWVVTDSVGGAYTKIARFVRVVSANILELWVGNQLEAATSRTITFSHAVGNSTACDMSVLRVAGMSKTGAAAVKQSAGQSNQAAANTPNPAFAATTDTNNVCIGAVANGVNPATMTPTTGWTEAHDVGVATPITGLETQFINSGFVGTTVTWGST